MRIIRGKPLLGSTYEQELITLLGYDALPEITDYVNHMLPSTAYWDPVTGTVLCIGGSRLTVHIVVRLIEKAIDVTVNEHWN